MTIWRDRRRLTETVGIAAQSGFHPAHGIPAPWVRLLPDQGRGLVRQIYVGQRTGRQVVLAEYRYKIVDSGVIRRINISVAVIALHAPHPPQQGPGRSGPWFVAGTDLLACRGGELQFPAILSVVDELLEVAARLESAG